AAVLLAGRALSARGPGHRPDAPRDLLLRLPRYAVEVPGRLLPRRGAGVAALRAADAGDAGDLPAAHGPAPGAHVLARPAVRARADAGGEQRGVRAGAAADADRRGGEHRVPRADHRRAG